MRHNTRTCGKFVSQFYKSEILRSVHAGIKGKFRNGCSHSGHSIGNCTLHFSTPHLRIYHIVIHRRKTKQIGCHLTIQRKRRTITCSRAQWITIGDIPGRKKHLQIVGQTFGISSEPQTKRRRHSHLQMRVSRQKHIFVTIALSNQHIE